MRVPHYQVYGSGFPVIFVHGFCEDSRIWDHWRDRFPGCQVLRIDLPGFGKTPISQDYSIEDMATLIIAAMNQSGIDKGVLIGHSMGGYVGLALAERYPDRLLGLGLLHSHPFADLPETKTARLKRKAFVKEHGAAAYVKQVIPSLFAPAHITLFAETIAILVQRAVQFPDQGITNALQAMHDRPDRSEVLRQLKVPALFIVGQQDQAVPAEYSSQQLGLADRAIIHIDKEIGHMGMFEDSERYLQRVRAFVRFCRLSQPTNS